MASRAPTTFAVGFLLLDALLLAYIGFALGRWVLVLWGAIFLVVALVVVLFAWPWYRRLMSDLERDRREMRAKVESIRELLHGKRLDN